MQKWKSNPAIMDRLKLSNEFAPYVKSGLTTLINDIGPDEIVKFLPLHLIEKLRSTTLLTAPKRVLVSTVLKLEDSIQVFEESKTDPPTTEPIINMTPTEIIIESPIPNTPSSSSVSISTDEYSYHVRADLLDANKGYILQPRTSITYNKKRVNAYWATHGKEFLDKLTQIRTPFPKICTALDCDLCLSFLYTAEITACTPTCEGRHVFDAPTIVYPHLSPTMRKKLKKLHTYEIRCRPLICNDVSPNGMYFVAHPMHNISVDKVIKVQSYIDKMYQSAGQGLYLTDTDTEDRNQSILKAFPSIKRGPQKGVAPDCISSNSTGEAKRRRK